MFWNQSAWREYPDRSSPILDEGLSLLCTQNSEIDAAVKVFREARFRPPETPSPSDPESSSVGQLHIALIRWMVLEFYETGGEKPLLVELNLDRGETNRGALYFCICPSESAEVSAPSAQTVDAKIIALSGSRAPLTELSRIYKVNLDHVEVFGDFFCSFIAGEDGPFCIIQSPGDVQWAKGPLRIFDGERQERLLEDIPYAGPKPLATLDEARKEVEAQASDNPQTAAFEGSPRRRFRQYSRRYQRCP